MLLFDNDVTGAQEPCEKVLYLPLALAADVIMFPMFVAVYAEVTATHLFVEGGGFGNQSAKAGQVPRSSGPVDRKVVDISEGDDWWQRNEI